MTDGKVISLRDMWSTPDWVIDFARQATHPAGAPFDVDVCCVPTTAKASVYFTPDTDGLKQDWGGGLMPIYAWCNPPYSDIRPWIEKAIEQTSNNVTTCMLVNADHTTAWYRRAIEAGAVRVNVPRRIVFNPAPGLLNKHGEPMKATSNPFPSMLLIFVPGIMKGTLNGK